MGAAAEATVFGVEDSLGLVGIGLSVSKRRKRFGLAPIQCSSLGARRVKAGPGLRMMTMMNREIYGTLKVKLWLW